MVNIIKILIRSLNHTSMKTGIGSFLLLSVLLLSPLTTYAKEKTYGPVKSGQTLWGIAYKTRPRGISRLSMMKALHRYNPSAFEKGNINLLKKGATLNVPLSKRQVLNILANKEAIPEAPVNEEQKSPASHSETEQIIALQKDLISVKKELLASRETLKGLTDQEAKLAQSSKQLATINTQLNTLSEQYKVAQNEIKQLRQENTNIRAQQINPATHKAIAVELNALKKQNSLLQREIQEGIAPLASDSKTQFSQTIAALNADIDLLKTKIHDLEGIEKLKDSHIAQLQSSLDRATTVIKNQAAVNKRIFDQLNALEIAQKNTSTATAIKPVVMTAEEKLLFKSSSTPTQQSAVPSTKSTSVLSSLAGVSPRFWLIITLSVLLLVLALLWRHMFPKDNFDNLT